MILTNQFTVKWNFEAVDRDFDVFCITKPKEMYKCNVLDIQDSDVQALSVQYSFGKSCLALFRKGAMSVGRLSSYISDEYPDVTVRKIDILSEQERSACFYYQCRLLALLLINSISVPKKEGYTYNNLSGKLFYTANGWKSLDKDTGKPYCIKFLEVTFDPGMYLNANVKTFRNNGDGKKTRYVYDKKSGAFRRLLRSDTGYDKSEIFSEASFKGKRNTVPYINFKSAGSFYKSKAGVICRFLDDVKGHLGEYFSLEQHYRDNDTVFSENDAPVAVKKEKEKYLEYGKILNEMGVNIADECGTPISRRAVRKIAHDLAAHYGVCSSTGPVKDGMYNIRIIFDKEHYQKNNDEDRYAGYIPGAVTQHITFESAEAIEVKESAPDPIIRKLVLELILKGDVRHGKIRIYDWEKLSLGKEWTFVYPKKIKGTKEFDYYAVRISPDGCLHFSSFSDNDLLLPDMDDAIRSTFRKNENDLRLHDSKHVEGLLFTDPGNMHIIARTCMCTMPEIGKIRDALVQTNPKDILDPGKVKNALVGFMERYPEDEEYASTVYRGVEQHAGPLTKKDLKELMNPHKKAGKKLNRYLHEEHGIWIMHELKDSAFKDIYRLGNMTDIRYFIDEKTAGRDLRTFNYYAGIKSSALNLSLHSACVIREVRALGGDIEFDELLPLMAVDFVRIARYTILPFPFKYLREYAQICEHKDASQPG